MLKLHVNRRMSKYTFSCLTVVTKQFHVPLYRDANSRDCSRTLTEFIERNQFLAVCVQLSFIKKSKKNTCVYIKLMCLEEMFKFVML